MLGLLWYTTLLKKIRPGTAPNVLAPITLRDPCSQGHLGHCLVIIWPSFGRWRGKMIARWCVKWTSGRQPIKTDGGQGAMPEPYLRETLLSKQCCAFFCHHILVLCCSLAMGIFQVLREHQLTLSTSGATSCVTCSNTFSAFSSHTSLASTPCRFSRIGQLWDWRGSRIGTWKEVTWHSLSVSDEPSVGMMAHQAHCHNICQILHQENLEKGVTSSNVKRESISGGLKVEDQQKKNNNDNQFVWLIVALIWICVTKLQPMM